jgi:5'-nucleotidase
MDILLTNDDGIHADGLKALAEAVQPLGDLTIIAPDREQSATSHSLTLHRPLRINRVRERVLSVDGTPTDCVLLGVHGFLKRKPGLVLSGINHGPNMGEDVSYSGTVAAAMEGTFLGIPSIAVSLAQWTPQDWGPAKRIVHALVRDLLAGGIPPRLCLNVNIPPIPWPEIRGLKVTRLGKRVYHDVIVEKTDPRGKLYYWIGGEDVTWEQDESSDMSAVKGGFVSLTPLTLELTDYRAMVDLESMGLKLDDRA